MKIKSKLKYVWLTTAIFSVVLTTALWFGYGSESIQNIILALNALMFLMSLPCSLFVIPVVILSNRYLDIAINSTEGIYLTTVFLSVIGLMQWFWIMRFWSPSEQPYQRLNLVENQ